MIDKGFVSFLCSCGSLLAVIVVFAGLLKNSKPTIITGQIIGGLDLILCMLFFVLYL